MFPSLRLVLLAGGVAAVLAVSLVYLLRSRRQTPEQRERERRLRLASLGRLADGTVIDVRELPPPEGKTIATQLLIFHYDVAGVTYEASQDVTWLRHLVDLHTCRLGIHTSVKYDPQNPGNSIVVAEGWSGLGN